MVNFRPANLKCSHLIDRYFEGLKPLNIVNDGKGMDFFFKDETLPFTLPTSYNVLVLGAAHATKRIPVEKCNDIIQKSAIPMVLLGGADVEVESHLLSTTQREVINLVGKTTIDQSAKTIAGANHVFSGDTGLMHLAAALKKPVTVYWGNTTPAMGMYPYYGAENNVKYFSKEVLGLNCRPCSKIGYKKCPRGHFRCMLEQ